MDLNSITKPTRLINQEKVENNIDNHLAIRNCSGFKPDLIDNYSLLLLKYGGSDLHKFGKYIKELSTNDDNTRIIEHFWLEVSRILFGIKILYEPIEWEQCHLTVCTYHISVIYISVMDVLGQYK